jgi:ABC-type transport system involved in multi-copper enzyme maturation permease subunit
MTLPQFLYALRWLVWDTFRQAFASGIIWVMLLVSVICIIFCLSISVEGGKSGLPPDSGPSSALPPNDPEAKKASKYPGDVEVFPEGAISVGFGMFRVPFNRYASDYVRYVQMLLAGGVADTFGVLLTLIWTAGFLPTFLDPSVASVLLAKPLPRWALLVGKYLGVLAFVLVQAVFFVVGTWLALGLRTGLWDAGYLMTIPMLLLHFGIFFSFSLLLAVWTRSAVVCVFGSLLFWLLCWAVNHGRMSVALSHPNLHADFPTAFWMVEISYWILPKPSDFGYLLFQGLNAKDSFSPLLDYRLLEHDVGVFYPVMSVVSSLIFTVVVLGTAAYEFLTTDY